MKLLFGLLLATLTFIAAAQHGRQRTPKGAKIFFVNDTSFDFGTITEGSEPSHEFVFKNVGDTPLIIQRVTNSGSCVEMEWDWKDNKVLPGKTGKIKVTLMTSHREGMSGRLVYVFSNSEGNPIQTLVLKTQVVAKASEPEVAATPPRFQFLEDKTFHRGTIPQGMPGLNVFYFINAGGSPLVINRVRDSCNCFGLNWIKTPVMPGERGWVEAELTENFTRARLGPFDKAIYIYSNAGPADKPVMLRMDGVVEATSRIKK